MRSIYQLELISDKGNQLALHEVACSGCVEAVRKAYSMWSPTRLLPSDRIEPMADGRILSKIGRYDLVVRKLFEIMSDRAL